MKKVSEVFWRWPNRIPFPSPRHEVTSAQRSVSRASKRLSRNKTSIRDRPTDRRFTLRDHRLQSGPIKQEYRPVEGRPPVIVFSYAPFLSREIQ